MTYYIVNEPQRRGIEGQKPDTKGHLGCDPLTESIQNRQTQRWEADHGAGGGGEGSDFSWDWGGLLLGDKNVLLVAHCEYTKANELCIFKWLVR